MVKFTAQFLSFFLILLPAAQAATVSGFDCSDRTKVQAAFDSTAEGGEVFFDCAAGGWASPVSVTKGVTVRGRGKSATTLTGAGGKLFDIDGSGGAFRMTALGITGNTGDEAVTIDGSFSSLRIDNCKFNNLPSRAFIIGYNTRYQTAITGVFDHIEFINNGSAQFILLYGNDYSWKADEEFGSLNFIFIEDSTFTWTGPGGVQSVVDGEHGARFVIRHNQITNGQLQWHDTGSTHQARATRAFEIYGNTFRCVNDPDNDCGWGAIGLRGGTGVIYDNIIPIYASGIAGYENGSVSQIWRADQNGSSPWVNKCDSTADRVCSNQRSHCSGGDHRGCGGDYDCPGIGTCVDSCTANSQCPSGTTCLTKIDGQLNSFGWPCRDQTGVGADDPVTGEQRTSPLYWWNNRTPSNSRIDVYIENTDYIIENREYFDEQSPFSGVVGMGIGLRSARPASCTPGAAYPGGVFAPGTGYWASDEKKLYVCTAPNTWGVRYVPSTYPHPLTGGAPQSPPQPPRNLRVTG